MVPHVTAGGSSFKGAAAYYLHDKEAETAERVTWTETINLITSNPETATRVMAATAMAQKRAESRGRDQGEWTEPGKAGLCLQSFLAS